MLENEVGNYLQAENVHQHLANRLDHPKISEILPEHCLSLIPFHQFSNNQNEGRVRGCRLFQVPVAIAHHFQADI